MQANPLPLPPALYAQSGQSVIIHQPGRLPAEFVSAASKQAAATIAAALARTPGELTLKNPGGLAGRTGVMQGSNGGSEQSGTYHGLAVLS